MTPEEKMIWAAAFALALRDWEELSPASFREASRGAYACKEAAKAVQDFRDAAKEDMSPDAERLRWFMAT